MKRIGNPIDDFKNRTVDYELDDGRRIRLCADSVSHYGAAALLRELGFPQAEVRLDVHWGGKKIGTVPVDFDPQFIRSQNFLYEPRPGDFKRAGDIWVADRMLGPGDLEAVDGLILEPDWMK